MEKIVLSGMMGSGKSTVGRLLSRWLGWEFVDTDPLIEELEGRGIPQIFEAKGEGYFRGKEREVAARLSGEKNVVISTGGGMLLSEENLKALSSKSLVFFLHAEPEELSRRIGNPEGRPLLQGRKTEEALREIFERRKEGYRRIENWIRTDGKRLEEVGIEILYKLPAELQRIEEEPEEVWLGKGALKKARELLQEESLFIAADSLPQVLIEEARECIGQEPLLFPQGEEVKSFHFAEPLYQKLIENKAGRGTPLLVMGGGSLCDLGGFVASTFKRGIPLYLLPTTLLSQADAGLGGKNALNLPPIKNVIGTFYHPKAVILDLYFLLTLNFPDYISGLAEVVKAGLLGDRKILELLRGEGIRERRLSLLSELIRRSVRVKLQIVRKDFRESNERRFLNFGHTLAHALEISQGLRHGEAVSLGMVFALEVGEKMGLTRKGLRKEVEEILQKLGLPVELKFPKEELIDKISQDKKFEKGKINFVLLEDYEKPFIYPVSLEELSRWLYECL